MARPIDADILLQEFDDMEPYEEYENEHDLWLDIRMEILNAPTLTPPNEWVSVDKRLPEHLKDVIALYGNGRIDIDWVDSSGDFQFGSLFDGVTNWMHLPAPPTKEE